MPNCSAHIPVYSLKSMLVHARWWFELALLSMCSQWSSDVHMHVDPSCLLPHHSGFKHYSFWVAPDHHPPSYILDMLSFKFTLGLMFSELVSILFAIVPDHGNEYMTKENKNFCTKTKFKP